MFRDLVATGRSRMALFSARVPGAWALVLPIARRRAGRRRRLRRARRRGRPDAATLVAGARPCSPPARSRRRLRRPRRTDRLARHVIGVALAFQLGVSPLLAQIERARRRPPRDPADRGRPPRRRREPASSRSPPRSRSSLAWSAAALAAGAWRTPTAGDLELRGMGRGDPSSAGGRPAVAGVAMPARGRRSRSRAGPALRLARRTARGEAVAATVAVGARRWRRRTRCSGTPRAAGGRGSSRPPRSASRRSRSASTRRPPGARGARARAARRARRRPRSGCASPASCTTRSVTTSR